MLPRKYPWMMRYGVAAAMVALTLWFRLVLDPLWGDRLPLLPFGVAAMGAAWFGGAGPGLLAALAGAVIGDWFFNAPRHTLLLWEMAESAGLVLSLLAATLISLLLRRLYEDLEKQKQAERLLQQQNQSLAAMAADQQRQAADLARVTAAKDQFLATLSHELRTPLTPVLLAAQTLAADPSVPAPVREDMMMITHNIELEARLIDDLLDLTRIARGKLELRRRLVDIHRIMEDAVQTCCSGNPKGQSIAIICDLAASEHWTCADPARIEQVFWNLINNALKFTPEGGTITIRTQDSTECSVPGAGFAPHSAPGVAPPGSAKSRHSILITVQDTGVGIDPGDLVRIFDAFEQGGRSTTRRFGGLGLGLAICKAVVEMHGGTIAARSEGRNRGAAFQISLPISSDETTKAQGGNGTRGKTVPSPSSLAHAIAPSPSLHILLVEDHELTLRSLTHLLETCGHHVTAAGNLGSARRAAQCGHYDLLVSDLGLPDGSGLDLMRQLRKRGVPGIALSGFGMEQDIRASHEAGFAEHLTKPVSLQQLEQSILAVTAQAAGHPGDASLSL